MATAVPISPDRSVHNTARPARTIAVYIHGPTEPLLYAHPALACVPACATRARTVCATAGTPNPKCAQLPHILVAACMDSGVHLLCILAQHRGQGGADRPQSESQMSFILPLVLHQPLRARSAATRALNDQPWTAGVHNIAAMLSHNNPPSGQRPSPTLRRSPPAHS